MCVFQEAFYKNDNGGEGFISYRLRFIAQNTTDEEMKKNVRRRKRKSTIDSLDTENKRQKTTIQTSENVTVTSEIAEHIEFLKNACPNIDKTAILERMALTYAYRRTLGDNFLQTFPRFLDTSYLVRVQQINLQLF